MRLLVALILLLAGCTGSAPEIPDEPPQVAPDEPVPVAAMASPAPEPYHETQEWAGRVLLSTGARNHDNLYPQVFLERDLFDFEVTNATQSLVLELRWERTVGPASEMYLRVKAPNGTYAVYTESAASQYLQVVIAEPPPGDWVVDASPNGAVAEQKYNVWKTAFYHMNAPDGFTATP